LTAYDSSEVEDGVSISLFGRTLGELFDNCGGGSIAALNENSVIVSVDDVPSGLACGCTCIVCNRPLVAKKGHIQSHHFAHKAGEFDPDCERAGETLLHRYAKTVLAREKRLFIPAVVGTDEWGPLEIWEGGLVEFDSVELERRFGNVIPDVVGHLASRDLFIEFLVTHPCSWEKLQKLKKLDVGVVEIDLSAYRSHRLDELDEVIVSIAPRRTLQSRAMARIPLALSARRRQLFKELPKALATFLSSTSVVPRDALTPPLLFNLSSEEIQDQILRTTSRPPFFAVPEEEWKAWVVMELRERTWASPADIAASMPEDFLVRGYRSLDPRVVHYARKYASRPLMTCTEQVELFLESLLSAGLACFKEGKFGFLRRIDMHGDAYARSVALIGAILEALGKDRMAFRYRDWFGETCSARGTLGRSNLIPAEKANLERDLISLARAVFESGSLPNNDLNIGCYVDRLIPT